MGILFIVGSEIPNPVLAGAVFDAIVAFEARLSVLDATCAQSTRVSPENKEIWAALSARLRKQYKRRHELAHFSIADEIATATRIAPFFTWNKHFQNGNKYLTVPQIHERTDRFNGIVKAVNWFTSEVQRAGLPKGHPGVQVPEPPLIVHIRELLAQQKAGQTPQPRPSGEYLGGS